MPAATALARPGMTDPTRNATSSHGEIAFAACDQPVGRTLWRICVAAPVTNPATSTIATAPTGERAMNTALVCRERQMSFSASDGQDVVSPPSEAPR